VELKQYSMQEVTVLALEGRLDSYSVPKLRAQLKTSTNQHPSKIVVDLASVSFIDSTGLAALIQGMRTCRDGGGNLCLSNPQRPVRLILELTRLDSAIDIFPNEHEAVASFQHPLNS
jgi:anti-sigma B factor antagonist